jgi:hypothetical protein
MPPGTDDVCQLPPDGDGDGSRADVDCADADATRHPGAVESCGDGVDQDCSGADLPCAAPTGPDGVAGSSAMAGAAGGVLGGAGQAGPAGAPGALQPDGAWQAGFSGGSAGEIASQAGSAGQTTPQWIVPAPQRSVEAAGCGVAAGTPQRAPSPARQGFFGVLALGTLTLALRGARSRRRSGRHQPAPCPFQNRAK